MKKDPSKFNSYFEMLNYIRISRICLDDIEKRLEELEKLERKLEKQLQCA